MSTAKKRKCLEISGLTAAHHRQKTMDSLCSLCIKVVASDPKQAFRKDSTSWSRAKSLLKHTPKEYGKWRGRYLKQRLLKAIMQNATGGLRGTIIPDDFWDPNFRSLDISHSHFNADTLSKIISRTVKLREIKLSGCFYVDDSHVSSLLSLCPKIETLQLESCRRITDKSVTAIIESGKNLTNIDLSGNYSITYDAVSKLLQSHPNRNNWLEIHLSGLPLWDSFVQTIAENCPKLHAISLGYSAISSDIIEHLVQTLTGIKYLRLHWNPNVTDVTLRSITAAVPGIRKLDICGCTNVTAVSVEQFISEHAPLKTEKRIKFTTSSQSKKKRARVNKTDAFESGEDDADFDYSDDENDGNFGRRKLTSFDCRFINITKALKKHLLETYPQLSLLYSVGI